MPDWVHVWMEQACVDDVSIRCLAWTWNNANIRGWRRRRRVWINFSFGKFLSVRPDPEILRQIQGFVRNWVGDDQITVWCAVNNWDFHCVLLVSFCVLLHVVPRLHPSPKPNGLVFRNAVFPVGEHEVSSEIQMLLYLLHNFASCSLAWESAPSV